MNAPDPHDDTPEAAAHRGELAEAAIGDFIRKVDPDAMATRWVLVVEAIDRDDRYLWVFAPNDAKPQDSLGLMTHATHLEQAATLARMIDP
jgi:hypothetical protein